MRSATYEPCDLTVVLKKQEEFEQCLRELHVLDPENFPCTELTEAMKNELASMLGVGWKFVCSPLNRDILHELSQEEEVSWNLKKVSLSDFVLPTVSVHRELMSTIAGVSEQAIFTDVFSIIRYGNNLPFLSEEAREKYFPDIEEVGDEMDYGVNDVEETDHHLNDIENVNSIFATSHKKQMPTINDILCAAVHASGMTLAKTCGDCVVDKNTIIPPRYLIKDIMSDTGFNDVDGEYGTALYQYNLWCIMGKPIHPAILPFEPVNHLAMEATDSFVEDLRSLDKKGNWIYRNGSTYVLDANTHQEAWGIIFKCIVCCMISPPSLLQIFHHCSQDNDGSYSCQMLLPSPDTASVTKFLNVIHSYKWSSRLLHSNFSKTVNGCIVLTLSTCCCVCSTLFIRTVTCPILPRLLLITANAYTAPAVLLNRFPKATRAKNPLAFAWARLLTATCA